MEVLSFITSTVALCLYSISYFFNTKRNYLIFQLSGNVFLSLSYLFMGSYFTMVSVAIGIARGLLCYMYEKKDKKVPVYVILGLCLATVSSYFIINFGIMSDSSPWDVLYLMSSCAYAVTFAMRNIRVMRYAVLVPNALAVAYNLLIKAPISSAISYGVEFVVTVVAIIKCEIKLARDRKKNLT